MRSINGLKELPETLEYPVMAIGVFDGIHRGHQEVIQGLADKAHARNGACVVLTFWPHPQKIISSAGAPLLIQTLEQKEEMLGQLGVDLLVIVPFTQKLSFYSPEKFVREILHNYGIREMHVGSNFRFGHQRSGNIQTLQLLGEELGFEIYETAPVMFRGKRISSTAIRKALSRGQVAFAKRMLGRPYQILGTVVRGAGRGAGLGFPTANLNVENELIPATGVYVTQAHLDGQFFPSVTNVGFRPTVEDGVPTSTVVETHIIDTGRDVYGKAMGLDFCFRLRGEKKFSGVEALSQQIRIDVEQARTYLGRLKNLEGRSDGLNNC